MYLWTTFLRFALVRWAWTGHDGHLVELVRISGLQPSSAWSMPSFTTSSHSSVRGQLLTRPDLWTLSGDSERYLRPNLGLRPFRRDPGCARRPMEKRRHPQEPICQRESWFEIASSPTLTFIARICIDWQRSLSRVSLRYFPILKPNQVVNMYNT